jgi:hypothetical protein
MKQIFITSFNAFKKALTYDDICDKLMPHRDRMLVVVDEVPKTLPCSGTHKHTHTHI